MIDVSSADLQKNFGHYKRVALNEPIRVTIHGRGTLVLISADEYARLQAGAPPAPPAPAISAFLSERAGQSDQGGVSDLERIAKNATDSGVRFRDDHDEA